jgi:hypothetical protein
MIPALLNPRAEAAARQDSIDQSLPCRKLGRERAPTESDQQPESARRETRQKLMVRCKEELCVHAQFSLLRSLSAVAEGAVEVVVDEATGRKEDSSAVVDEASMEEATGEEAVGRGSAEDG